MNRCYYLILIWLLSLFSCRLDVWAQSPEQDCSGAVQICASSYTYPVSFSGQGAFEDVGGNTCLSGVGETNSVWFTFQVQSAGSFAFTINTQNDYDWALYDVTNTTCANLPNTTPIRCNFSGTP
ncbi:MAG: hypothetical protein NZ108_03010, partial [Bacteroidia bacterium]|nr:hypothetical protein [Bacteroidia bacterium]